MGSHTDRISHDITINAESNIVWQRLRDIRSMKDWAVGVTDVKYTTTKRFGVGAGRVIVFENADDVEEYMIQWSRFSFTYIATRGLPLCAYMASINVIDESDHTRVNWQSFLKSEDTTRSKFDKTVKDMKMFYQDSLAKLKSELERYIK